MKLSLIHTGIVVACITIIAWLLHKSLRNSNTSVESYTNTNTNTEVKKAMIIVEPRKHKLLQPVISNFHLRMNPSWDLYVFHGRLNKLEAEIAVQGIHGRNVFLKQLEYDNLTTEDYNALFKEERFWNQIDAEHILVFQTDTVTCSKSPHSIDRFLQYGYIGCSAYKDVIGVHPRSLFGGADKWFKKASMKEYPFYGIGGLSLRKKSFTVKCIRDMPEYPKDFPEDVFYGTCVSKANSILRPESASVLMDFCTQGSYEKEHKGWGAHKTNETISASSPFYEFCPEARMLI